MKHEIETFLHKNMSRKDFLRHVGLLMLAVIGISNVLKYISGTEVLNPKTQRGNGYGSNPYGGDKKRRNS